MEKKQISELIIGDLFSFTKNGAVHMVANKFTSYIEYKSYSDGKIRTEYISRQSPVYLRPTWEPLFNKKYFVNLQ